MRLRGVQPADMRAELAHVYDSVCPHRPGMMARDNRWWQAALHDPESGRRGMSPQKCLLASDDLGPRGYALYRAKPDWDDDGLPYGRLAVRDVVGRAENEFLAADAGGAELLAVDARIFDLFELLLLGLG